MGEAARDGESAGEKSVQMTKRNKSSLKEMERWLYTGGTIG